MSTSFDITPTVIKYSAMPQERVRIVRSFENLPVVQIRRGIVYLLAAWSGPSVMFFRRITELLARFDTSPVEFFVVDIDCVPSDFFAAFERHAPAGAGETLWIRDGVVSASVGTYTPANIESVFLKHTKELIDDYVA